MKSKITMSLDKYNKLLDDRNSLFKMCKEAEKQLYECLGLMQNNDWEVERLKIMIKELRKTINKVG